MEDETIKAECKDSKDFNDLANLLGDSNELNILIGEKEDNDIHDNKKWTENFSFDLEESADFKKNKTDTVQFSGIDDSTPIVIVSTPKTEDLMVQTDTSTVKVESKKELQVSCTEIPSVKLESEITAVGEQQNCPSGSLFNPYALNVKKESSAFSNGKRSMAIHRQNSALRNSENIIALSNEELQLKRKYYDQKLYHIARNSRANAMQSRVLRNIANKLVYHPWSFFITFFFNTHRLFLLVQW